MNESADQERQVRRFLLGQLEEDERQLVEENLIVDDKYRTQVLLAEETLIEDYLDEILSKDDHEAFEACFGATAQLRRKVEIASALRDYSPPKLRDAGPPASTPKRWSYRLVIKKNAVVFTSIAAAVLLIMGFGAWQGVRFWRESNEKTRQIEIGHELSKLNNSTVEASTYSLALAPVSTRDASDASTLSLPLSAQIIELRLILTGSIHSHYTVELSKIGTTEKYHIDELHAQSTENGQAVVVRIPSRLLTRGDYRLSLKATAETYVSEYNFHVRS
jgi:hypothetical protein